MQIYNFLLGVSVAGDKCVEELPHIVPEGSLYNEEVLLGSKII